MGISIVHFEAVQEAAAVLAGGEVLAVVQWRHRAFFVVAAEIEYLRSRGGLVAEVVGRVEAAVAPARVENEEVLVVARAQVVADVEQLVLVDLEAVTVAETAPDCVLECTFSS